MTETSNVQAAEPASTAAVVQLPSAPQTRGRQWVKGQSGNPRGRPLRTYSTAEKIRAALVEELAEILETVVQAARGGDLQACRLILDRVIAPLKPIEIPTPMAAVNGTLTEQGAQIIAAMTCGQITPAQCAQLLLGLGAHARAVEIDNMTGRLDAIEKLLEERDAETQPKPR